jgi:hypothetical protein
LTRRLDLLHRLATGQRAEAVDEGLVVDQIPQLLGAAACQRVFDRERAAQAIYICSGVAALDALPAGILIPILLNLGDFLFFRAHCLSSNKKTNHGEVPAHPLHSMSLGNPYSGHRWPNNLRPFDAWADTKPVATCGSVWRLQTGFTGRRLSRGSASYRDVCQV